MNQKELDKKIIRLHEDFLRKEKIAIHLRNLQSVIARHNNLVAKLEKQLIKEERDILKLESMNLFALFSTLLGTKEQQLEKERQEFLQALLQHKGGLKKLEELEKEKALLDRQASAHYSTANQLKKLVFEKEKLIRGLDHPIQPALFQLNERIANHRAKLQEIRNAAKEATRTQRILERIILGLKKLEDWGGKKSTKSSNLVRQIERNIFKANNQLQKFVDQLFDIEEQYQETYLSQVLIIQEFLEQLVDSLITDWVIQKRIHNALHLVDNVFDRLERISIVLEHEKNLIKGYIAAEEKEKQELIVQHLKMLKS